MELLVQPARIIASPSQWSTRLKLGKRTRTRAYNRDGKNYHDKMVIPEEGDELYSAISHMFAASF
jgi:hypothetical protein